MLFIRRKQQYLVFDSEIIGVFSKWSGTFIDFSEFRESEESLKHEFGSVKGSALLPVSLWSSGIISVS